MRRLALLALVLAAACSDALEQTSTAGQVIAFGNSSALTLITAVDFRDSTVGLSVGYPLMRVAGRQSVFLVVQSTGIRSDTRVTVLDLVSAGATSDAFSLAAGGAATAIQNDSIAWITMGGTVARANYRTHGASSVTVGGIASDVLFTAGNVFVVTAAADGASWIAVIDPARDSVVDSIPLTGTYAGSAALGGDSLLYVVTAGAQGRADGRVSVVHPVARRELAVINGLGDGAGAPLFHPSGRLLVGSATQGILEVNTLTRTLTHGPGGGKKPGGHGVTGLALDNRGRVYAGDAVSCTASPGVVHVLSAPPDYDDIRSVAVSGCPLSAAVAVRP